MYTKVPVDSRAGEIAIKPILPVRRRFSAKRSNHLIIAEKVRGWILGILVWTLISQHLKLGHPVVTVGIMATWRGDLARASKYGESIAEFYDDLVESRLGDPGPVAIRLAEIARGGTALELGIGTGRVAIPLSELGVEVSGIDASAAMLRKLREKHHGKPITAILGNFADVELDGSFALIYVVFNTFCMLTTADEQERCLINVAAHLEPGGAFVIEDLVLDEGRYDRGQRIHVHEVEDGRVLLEASRYDAVSQLRRSQHILLTDDGIKFFPVNIRLTAPRELDLMARLAGLELEHRWAGWDGEPFTSQSDVHVSVYRKPIQ